jgi:hypothetical protein
LIFILRLIKKLSKNKPSELEVIIGSNSYWVAIHQWDSTGFPLKELPGLKVSCNHLHWLGQPTFVLTDTSALRSSDRSPSTTRPPTPNLNKVTSVVLSWVGPKRDRQPSTALPFRNPTLTRIRIRTRDTGTIGPRDVLKPGTLPTTKLII